MHVATRIQGMDDKFFAIEIRTQRAWQHADHIRQGDPAALGRQAQAATHQPGMQGHRRSEEHTSELQSLRRISYAVFCLKKKKKTTQNKPVRTKLNTTKKVKNIKKKKT